MGIATFARWRSRRRGGGGWAGGGGPGRGEVAGHALRSARTSEPHVGRVVLANPKAVKGITRAGAKTDKIDARTLAKLLAGGFLPAVWLPDEQTRILRRRISARR